MTTDLKQTKEKNLRMFEIVNSGNLERMDQITDELYAPDVILHFPPQPDLPPGAAGIKQFLHQLFTENTGIRVTPQSMFGEGDELALRYTWQGTSIATGKKTTLTLLNIGRYSGGKIVEEWELVGPPTVE